MAGIVLRNGPANEMGMGDSMQGRNVTPLSIIRRPFSRTARRSIPAFGIFQTASESYRHSVGRLADRMSAAPSVQNERAPFGLITIVVFCDVFT